jgi:hypothetical protein
MPPAGATVVKRNGGFSCFVTETAKKSGKGHMKSPLSNVFNKLRGFIAAQKRGKQRGDVSKKPINTGGRPRIEFDTSAVYDWHHGDERLSHAECAQRLAEQGISVTAETVRLRLKEIQPEKLKEAYERAAAAEATKAADDARQQAEAQQATAAEAARQAKQAVALADARTKQATLAAEHQRFTEAAAAKLTVSKRASDGAAQQAKQAQHLAQIEACKPISNLEALAGHAHYTQPDPNYLFLVRPDYLEFAAGSEQPCAALAHWYPEYRTMELFAPPKKFLVLVVAKDGALNREWLASIAADDWLRARCRVYRVTQENPLEVFRERFGSYRTYPASYYGAHLAEQSFQSAHHFQPLPEPDSEDFAVLVRDMVLPRPAPVLLEAKADEKARYFANPVTRITSPFDEAYLRKMGYPIPDQRGNFPAVEDDDDNDRGAGFAF